MEWNFTLHEIDRVAGEFWKAVGDSKVIAFHGEMGTGKTTFIQALCHIKQVEDVVGSPTYSIINEYNGRAGKMFHIDLYRLKSRDEAIDAGVEECLYSGNICMVEWPEKAPSLFPLDTVHVYFYVTDELTRRIRISDN